MGEVFTLYADGRERKGINACEVKVFSRWRDSSEERSRSASGGTARPARCALRALRCAHPWREAAATMIIRMRQEPGEYGCAWRRGEPRRVGQE